MSEFDPTQIPPELIADIDKVEADFYAEEDYDSVGSQILLEVFKSLPHITLDDISEYIVTYEVDNGVQTLVPIAYTKHGVVCEQMSKEGETSYIIVLGSLYIPGYDNKWRNIIETSVSMPKVVYTETDESLKFLRVDNTDGFIFDKRISSDSYLVTTAAYLDTKDIPNQIIDAISGYSEPEVFARITLLRFDDGQPIVIFAPLGADLSVNRISNIATIDKDGNIARIPSVQE